MVKTAIDAEQLKADIMKQLKEELQNEHKTAREKYATIKEEKNTQKGQYIGSVNLCQTGFGLKDA